MVAVAELARGPAEPAALHAVPAARRAGRAGDVARAISSGASRTWKRGWRRSPDDVGAAVALADALLRQTRVTGNAGLAVRAEQVLKRGARRGSRPTTMRTGCWARCICRSIGSAKRSPSAEKNRDDAPVRSGQLRRHRRRASRARRLRRGVRRLRSDDAAAAERRGVRARRVRARAAGQPGRRARVDEAGGRRDERRRPRRRWRGTTRRSASSICSSGKLRRGEAGIRRPRRRRFPVIRLPSSATRRRSPRRAIATGALALLEDLARTVADAGSRRAHRRPARAAGTARGSRAAIRAGRSRLAQRCAGAEESRAVPRRSRAQARRGRGDRRDGGGRASRHLHRGRAGLGVLQGRPRRRREAADRRRRCGPARATATSCAHAAAIERHAATTRWRASSIDARARRSAMKLAVAVALSALVCAVPAGAHEIGKTQVIGGVRRRRRRIRSTSSSIPTRC